MKKFTELNPKIEGIIRHILGIIGGILIAIGFKFGVADGSDPTPVLNNFTEILLAIIGGIVGIIAMIKSWFSPEKEEVRTVAVGRDSKVYRHFKMNDPMTDADVAKIIEAGNGPRTDASESTDKTNK